MENAIIGRERVFGRRGPKTRLRNHQAFFRFRQRSNIKNPKITSLDKRARPVSPLKRKKEIGRPTNRSLLLVHLKFGAQIIDNSFRPCVHKRISKKTDMEKAKVGPVRTTAADHGHGSLFKNRRSIRVGVEFSTGFSSVN